MTACPTLREPRAQATGDNTAYATAIELDDPIAYSGLLSTSQDSDSPHFWLPESPRKTFQRASFLPLSPTAFARSLSNFLPILRRSLPVACSPLPIAFSPKKPQLPHRQNTKYHSLKQNSGYVLMSSRVFPSLYFLAKPRAASQTHET